MLSTKSPSGLIAAGAFFCALVTTLPAVADPFPGRNLNPLKFIHGQPGAVPAKLPARSSIDWWYGLNISNTLNVEARNAEGLIYDYEAYHLDFGLNAAIGEGWALRLEIPLVHRGGGLFDSAIDNWHQALGLPRANRDNVPNDQFQITYINDGVTEVDPADSQGLADIQIGLGHDILNSRNNVLSGWLFAELPTGDLQQLTGNEKLDLAVLLAWTHRHSADWHSDSNIGVLFPGRDRLVTAPVAEHVAFGHLATEWHAFEQVNIKLQVNAHSRFYDDSEVRMLGSAYSLLFGVTVTMADCNRLDIAMAEDLKVDAAPDVSLLVYWHSRPC